MLGAGTRQNRIMTTGGVTKAIASTAHPVTDVGPEM